MVAHPPAGPAPATGRAARWRNGRLAIWLRRDKLAAACLAFVLLVILISILAPWISPYHPAENDLDMRYAGVGTPGHWLGTDGLGRDVLSRLLWGGRTSLLIGFLPVLIATLASVALGMIAGYFGGLVDGVIMRCLDVLFAFPMVLLALLLVGVLGAGIGSVVIALAVVIVPYISRVVRTAVLSELAMDYVLAARAAGASSFELLGRELLPNVVPPVLAYTTVLVGIVIVVGAGLSYLGLGVQPPAADWGLMVAEGQQVLREAPHVTIVPGLMIVVLAVVFNLLGDGIRDLLDPRLRT